MSREDREKLYTLEEAKKELARRKCLVRGHDYTVHSHRTINGKEQPENITCTCGEWWNVEQKVIV